MECSKKPADAPVPLSSPEIDSKESVLPGYVVCSLADRHDNPSPKIVLKL
jgi:hypothetical protein